MYNFEWKKGSMKRKKEHFMRIAVTEAHFSQDRNSAGIEFWIGLQWYCVCARVFLLSGAFKRTKIKLPTNEWITKKNKNDEGLNIFAHSFIDVSEPICINASHSVGHFQGENKTEKYSSRSLIFNFNGNCQVSISWYNFANIIHKVSRVERTARTTWPKDTYHALTCLNIAANVCYHKIYDAYQIWIIFIFFFLLRSKRCANYGICTFLYLMRCSP